MGVGGLPSWFSRVFEDICVYSPTHWKRANWIVFSTRTNIGRGRICNDFLKTVLSIQTMAVSILVVVVFAGRTMKHGEGKSYESKEPAKHRVRGGGGIDYHFGQGRLWSIVWVGNLCPLWVNVTTCEQHARHSIRNPYHETRQRDVSSV